MTKSQPAGSIVAIPLNKLHISPRNARPNDTSDVTGLAALLRSQDQLQNLIVHPDGDGYGVADGGRRLRAFQLRHLQGEIKPDHPIWCMLTDVDRALAVSVAANSEREPMHPADEFDAFKGLVDDGVTIEDVAAQFGVTPLVVRRRLLLSKVSPKLVALFRTGEMNLEQLQAFTLTENHELQERTWYKTAHWERGAAQLRARLTKGAKFTGSDRAARFVGLDAYESAGGGVVRDLFGSPDAGYIADDALMQRLAEEKLNGVAEQLRAEGWSFVKIEPEIGWHATHKYSRSKSTRRELTDAEKLEISQLEAVCAEKNERLYSNDEDAEDLTDGETDELEHAIAQAQARIGEIRASIETFTDRQKKKSGVLVGIDQNGQIEIHRGMIPPVDPKVQKAKEREKAKADAVARGEPEPAGFSEALLRKLTANRTAALAAHLLDCPRVALDLLCAHLATNLIYRGGFYGASGVMINAHSQQGDLARAANDIEGGKAWRAIEDKIADVRELLPENPADLLEALGNMPTAHVMEILCTCTALCLNGVVGNERAALPLVKLEQTIGFNMADWWEPTRASFLDQVSKPVIVGALKDAGLDPDGIARAERLKKGDLAVYAEGALAGSGWVPTPIRSAPSSAVSATSLPSEAQTVTECASDLAETATKAPKTATRVRKVPAKKLR